MSKIIVIGAGIAGRMAYNALSLAGHDVTVFDKAYGVGNSHQAIMHLRDPTVAGYLGEIATKISVFKDVLNACGNEEEGFRIQQPVGWARANNEYSLKLYGEIGDRSISTLGVQERWVMPSINSVPIQYIGGAQLVSISRGVAEFNCPQADGEHGRFAESYDFCVSTIPMFVLAKCLEDSKIPEHLVDAAISTAKMAVPIKVTRATLKMPSSVYQTYYVPSRDLVTYRASLEGNTIIIEHIDEISLEEIKFICQQFGLSYEFDISSIKLPQLMPIGKMRTLDEDIRKNIILSLTQELNVFSLGRFAIWKPIRTDVLVKDIDHIKRLMTLTPDRRHYESRID